MLKLRDLRKANTVSNERLLYEPWPLLFANPDSLLIITTLTLICCLMKSD
jgi:hypothetical protein